MLPAFTIVSGGMPVGAVIAFAGNIGPPVSTPADGNTYNPVSPPGGVATSNIEGWGWMVCDGRQLYCKDYPVLFMMLGFLYNQTGDTYGPDTSPGSLTSSDGDALFRIPDYRGYFLRGSNGNADKVDPDTDIRYLNYNAQKYPGVGSIQVDALQKHEHNYDQYKQQGTVDEGAAALAYIPTNTATTTDPNPQNQASPPADVNTSDFETRPKNIAVHYLIKFADIY